MAIVSSVDIPVPVFVKKYLTIRYGTEHKVSNTSLIGIMIIEMASKYYMKPVKGVPECGAVFSLPVTEYYYNQKVFRIQKRKLKQLTKLLIRLFYEDLVHTVSRDVAMGLQPTARQSLRKFLEYYDIGENELNINTAYMEWIRKGIKKSKKNKNQILSNY